MVINLKRPLLVGGLGLTFGLWLLDSLHHSVTELSGVITLGAVAAGAGLWALRQSRTQPLLLPTLPTRLERSVVEQAIAAVGPVLQQIEAETPELAEESRLKLHDLQHQMAELGSAVDREHLHITVMGGQRTGKTTLAQMLATAWAQSHQVTLQDTAGLFAAAESATVVANLDADLALFVTAADLTEPEFQVLQQLRQQGQRVLLVFNKQDQYLPADRPVLLQHLQQRVQEYLAATDVVAIAALPQPVKVRQHLADNSTQERIEQPAADVAALLTRLEQLVLQERQQLIWSTVWRQANHLKTEAQHLLNQLRRTRALPLIEQFQWVAAATAFANPVPTLDLVATTAIGGQLVLDLSAIYQQKFSLSQAQAVATTLASLLVKLGVVELSTQAIGTVLKSHVLTFVAGGVLQGVSAAYLTRLAGLSLIEYFEEQSLTATLEATDGSPKLKLDRLSQKIQAVFQQNRQSNVLQSFVQRGIAQLTPLLTPSLPVPTE